MIIDPWFWSIYANSFENRDQENCLSAWWTPSQEVHIRDLARSFFRFLRQDISLSLYHWISTHKYISRYQWSEAWQNTVGEGGG